MNRRLSRSETFRLPLMIFLATGISAAFTNCDSMTALESLESMTLNSEGQPKLQKVAAPQPVSASPFSGNGFAASWDGRLVTATQGDPTNNWKVEIRSF